MSIKDNKIIILAALLISVFAFSMFMFSNSVSGLSSCSDIGGECSDASDCCDSGAVCEYSSSKGYPVCKEGSNAGKGSMTVYVEKTDGSSVSYADVSVGQVDGSEFRSGGTGYSGSVDFLDLPLGEYEVTASKSGSEKTITEYMQYDGQEKDVTITLESEDEESCSEKYEEGVCAESFQDCATNNIDDNLCGDQYCCIDGLEDDNGNGNGNENEQNCHELDGGHCENEYKNCYTGQSIDWDLCGYDTGCCYNKDTNGCEDTDGGKNYGKRGTITSKSGQYTQDFCVTPNRLQEFYCRSDGTIGVTKVSCPQGCSSGVCTGGGPGGNPDGDCQNGVCTDICERCPDDEICYKQACGDGVCCVEKSRASCSALNGTCQANCDLCLPSEECDEGRCGGSVCCLSKSGGGGPGGSCDCDNFFRMPVGCGKGNCKSSEMALWKICLDGSCQSINCKSASQCGGGNGNGNDCDVSDCTDWANDECGTAGCEDDVMHQFRACPEGCSTDKEHKCNSNVSCEESSECMDEDEDGYGINNDDSCSNSGVDCNDSNGNINPGVTEGPDQNNCDDGLDNDCDGDIDTADSNCPEENTHPVALFTVNPEIAEVGEEFSFDASDSSDSQDTVGELKMRWDFEDDGNWDKSWTDSKTTTHSYSSEGNKTVKLEVKDTDGATSAASKEIKVLKKELGDVEITSGWNSFYITRNEGISRLELEERCESPNVFKFDSSGDLKEITSDKLQPGKGYIIRVDGRCKISSSGEVYDRSEINLHDGWNVKGSDKSVPISKVKDSCENPFVFFTRGGKLKSVEGVMEAGKGYMIRVDSGCTIDLS